FLRARTVLDCRRRSERGGSCYQVQPSCRTDAGHGCQQHYQPENDLATGLEGFCRVAERNGAAASPGSEWSLRVDDLRYARSLSAHCRTHREEGEAAGGRNRRRGRLTGKARRPERRPSRARRLLPRRQGTARSRRKSWLHTAAEIGRASCRERVWVAGGGRRLKKKDE